MANAFKEPALAVDTHVFRVSHRLGLTLGTTPRQVEDDLTELVPGEVGRRNALADSSRACNMQSAYAAVPPVPRQSPLSDARDYRKGLIVRVLV